MKHDLIFHLVSVQTWKDSIVNGAYRPASLNEDEKGSIQCCTPDQVESVANKKFEGKNNIHLIVIDVNRVSSNVRYSEFEGEEYPQIDGPLNMDAVIDKIVLEPDEKGLFEIDVQIN